MATRNSTPTFAQFSNTEMLQRALSDKKINPPIIGFCMEEGCFVYVSSDGTIYSVMADKMRELETKLAGLTSTDTGETISVKEYIDQHDTNLVEIATEKLTEHMATDEDIENMFS